MTSSFGKLFRTTTFGESHGPAVGVIVDGCPPRLPIDLALIQRDIDRRRTGQSRLVSQRKESDQVELLSGVFEGQTTGTPIAMVFPNKDQRPKAYDHLKDLYRPSHADYTYDAKYGFRDYRGGGRSSARETTSRVASAAIARQLLTQKATIEVLGWVSQIHTIESTMTADEVTFDAVEAHPTRCPDPAVAPQMEAAVKQASKDGDSLGGVVTVVAKGVPAGLGAPVFDRIEADLAKAMLSLPASKGFEVGSGFAGTKMKGSEHNDPFVPGESGPQTTSNYSGGVQGGISNGQDIVCRVAFKPTATIASAQQTVTTDGQTTSLAAKGRHDPCVLPRAVPVVEAMMLLVLADHWLLQRTVNID